jgi:hypothetical protein
VRSILEKRSDKQVQEGIFSMKTAPLEFPQVLTPDVTHKTGL